MCGGCRAGFLAQSPETFRLIGAQSYREQRTHFPHARCQRKVACRYAETQAITDLLIRHEVNVQAGCKWDGYLSGREAEQRNEPYARQRALSKVIVECVEGFKEPLLVKSEPYRAGHAPQNVVRDFFDLYAPLRVGRPYKGIAVL